MPKQPLRTNQIVSKLKAASSPVVYGTATNAIDALQLSLDSPTALGEAWYCRVGEEWKPMPVIDLGSNKYMAIEFSQTFGYIAAYYAEGQIRGTSEKKLAGISFAFLSKEDCNDTATQLINAGESKEIVNPNPSAEATATLEKLQVGETVYGIDSGSDVYELILSAADSVDLLTYMQGTSSWSIGLSAVDIEELVEYAAIKVKASVAIESDVISMECLLVKLAELDMNSLVAQAVFVSSDPIQLNSETTLFTIRIATEVDAEVGDLHVVLSGEPYAIKDSDITSELSTAGQVLTSDGQGGCSWQDPAGGGDMYVHTIGVTSNSFHSGDPVYNFTIISSRATAYDITSLCTWLKDNGFTSQGAGTAFPNSGYELNSKAPAFDGESGVIGLYSVAGIYSSNGTTLNLTLYGTKATLTTDGSTVTAAYNGYIYGAGYIGVIRRDVFYKIA